MVCQGKGVRVPRQFLPLASPSHPNLLANERNYLYGTESGWRGNRYPYR